MEAASLKSVAFSPLAERVMNTALGAGLISCCLIGLAKAPPSERMSVVPLFTAALHLCAGVLFLCRRPAVRDGSWRDLLITLPAFVAAAAAFNLAPPAHQWPLYAVLVFAAGAVTTVVSLTCLGRCFAVTPAVRGTVSHGPYRFIRHPAYASECLLVLACFLAGPGLATAACFVVLVPCLAVRIVAEERLLRTQSAYRAYCRQVNWRLLPGVW
jgi:protein-S-isoprenylcysteine O-methyltransferase Ste14